MTRIYVASPMDRNYKQSKELLGEVIAALNKLKRGAWKDIIAYVAADHPVLPILLPRHIQRQWRELERCDILVAIYDPELSTTGTLVEIGIACALNKLVYVLARENHQQSAYLTYHFRVIGTASSVSELVAMLKQAIPGKWSAPGG